MKCTYVATITSDFSRGIDHTVTTTSARTAGMQCGRAECGEVVTIRNKSGRILSRAIWSDEKRAYVSVTVDDAEDNIYS